jgi:CubicO group peptidase (beta-lactamase class C family)
MLLTKIVEVVSHQSFAEFMHDRIFAALGMWHTKALPIPQLNGIEMYGLAIHAADVGADAFESHQFSSAATFAG